MNFVGALKLAVAADKLRGCYVEAIRMNNLSRDSYVVIVKRADGNITEIDDPKLYDPTDLRRRSKPK
jgi:hypothetical protein